ncbi:hypothetical protein QUA80_12375 [Microcoleus sp. F4-D5]
MARMVLVAELKGNKEWVAIGFSVDPAQKPILAFRQESRADQNFEP